jgi:hypothetical protein
MAELELHHESVHNDPVGRKVGVLTAVLAVALAIVTIASHRMHASAILRKTTANDEWAHYQASRMKFHNVELGTNIVKIFGADKNGAAEMLADNQRQMQKYDHEAKELEEQANHADEEAEASEKRALRYDLGEGFLEIALVLSSLYFISKKMMFPTMGIIAGSAGVIIALTALLL